MDNDITKQPTVIRIKFTGDQLELVTNYKMWVKKKSEAKFLCAIPEFNIYFSTKKEEDIDKKAQTFMDFFFGYYLDSNHKFSLKKLGVNLHRLGFKPHNNPSGMANMIRNRPDKNTAFRMETLARPEDFEMASIRERSSTFAATA